MADEKLPKIAHRGILQTWHNGAQYGWDASAEDCHDCHYAFMTGDAFFLYGDPEAAITPAHYRCGLCLIKALGCSIRPTGAGVFVAAADRAKTFEELPVPTQQKIVTTLDQLDRLLAEAEHRMGLGGGGDAEKPC